MGNPRTDNKPRLVKIAVETLTMKRKILANVTKLRDLPEDDNFAKVYVKPDLTPKQLQASKNLWEILQRTAKNLQRTRREDQNHIYKIKYGKIIKVGPSLPAPRQD